MDIWGTKARRLQQELDQAREDLKEAREIIKGSYASFAKIVEDAAGASGKVNDSSASGASILYLQNRKRKALEPEPDNG